MGGMIALMVDQPSETDYIRLFIRNLQPTYNKHLRFTPFKNFVTFISLGMLMKKEMAKEMPKKASRSWKNNYHSKAM